MSRRIVCKGGGGGGGEGEGERGRTTFDFGFVTVEAGFEGTCGGGDGGCCSVVGVVSEFTTTTTSGSTELSRLLTLITSLTPETETESSSEFGLEVVEAGGGEDGSL